MSGVTFVARLKRKQDAIQLPRRELHAKSLFKVPTKGQSTGDEALVLGSPPRPRRSGLGRRAGDTERITRCARLSNMKKRGGIWK